MPVTTTIATRQDVLDYLLARIDFERTPNILYRLDGFKLDRMRELMERLGNPQRDLKIVHVAGTKGKGSTSSMIASMLTAAGYRTGLYTSPHLERLEERIQIGGCECSEADLVALMVRVLPIVQALDREAALSPQPTGGPTFFEITTAMALLHFQQEAVDAAVLEVGLGGRLDSTNICDPLVCVITTISFDHTKQLGDTLTAIATEKAGIIKPAVPVVTGVTQPEPLEVIERIARERGSPLYKLRQDFDFDYEPSAAGSASRGEEEHGRLRYRQSFGGREFRLSQLSVGLLGQHQANNAAVALAAVDCLRQGGWNVSESAMRRGLTDVRCPGRVEIVSERPTVVIDVAHNVAAIEALVRVLDERPQPRRRVLIFAASKDKDTTGMLRRLLPRFDTVIFTRFIHNPRSAEPAELLSAAETLLADAGTAADLVQPPRLTSAAGQQCTSPELLLSDNPAAALRLLDKIVSPEDLVCITGSFFLAAEMRSLLRPQI